MDRVIEKKHKWLNKKTIWITIALIFILMISYNIFFGDKSSKLNVEKDKITIESIVEDEFKDVVLSSNLSSLLLISRQALLVNSISDFSCS